MIDSPRIGIFEYFSKEEIDKIHNATLEVLEKVLHNDKIVVIYI